MVEVKNADENVPRESTVMQGYLLRVLILVLLHLGHQQVTLAATAMDDTAQTNANTTVNIDVLANDGVISDPNTLVAFQAFNGTTSVNNDDTIAYTPNTDFVGVDTFTYRVDGDLALVTVTVLGVVDLNVTQSDSGPVTVEQDLTFTITIVNRESIVASEVILTDELAEGVEFVSAESLAGSCSADSAIPVTVSCDFEDVGVNSTTILTLVVKPTRAGVLTHEVEVDSASVDKRTSNNISTQDVDVAPFVAAPLSLEIQDDLLADTFSALALANPIDTETEIQVARKENTREETSSQELDDSLPGKGQMAFLGSELNLPAGGTLVAQGVPSPVQGLFMAGDNASLRLDGVGEQEESEELYFAGVQESATEKTVLFVFNSNQADSNLSLKLSNMQGILLKEVTANVAAKGTLRGTLEDLFGEEGILQSGYVQLSSQVPVKGFQLTVTEQHFSSLTAQTNAITRRMVSPRFSVDGQGGATQINLLNVDAGATAADVTLRAFDEAANLLGTAEFQIEPRQLFVGDVKELLDLDPSESETITGYLEFEILGGFVGSIRTSPRLIGAVTFTGNQGKWRSRLPLTRTGLTQAMLPHLAQNFSLNLYTSLAILNMEDAPEEPEEGEEEDGPDVEIKVYDEAGVLSDEKTLQIRGAESVVDLLNGSTFFGSEFVQVNGHVEITTTVPLAIMAFFGDLSQEFLSAIEPHRLID